MVAIWQIILAAGIPSTIFSLLIGLLIKRENEREEAKEEFNILLIQGVGTAISLGKAAAIALRDGKTNGETKEALKCTETAEKDILNFLTKQGVKNII